MGTLPNGSYAAVVYHDENDNGTLDHKMDAGLARVLCVDQRVAHSCILWRQS